MKITKRRLDQIIQEEYNSMLQEQELHMRRSAPRHADAGRLEEQRLNQLIQEELYNMLLESAEDAATSAALKTAEKLGKSHLIKLVPGMPGRVLRVIDKTVKAAKGVGKGVALSDQYGVPGEQGQGSTGEAAIASMQLGITGTGAGGGGICFTQRCRNQRSYQKRMASNARRKAQAAGQKKPTKIVRIPNEEEKMDAWRTQILDAAGWLTSVPGMRPVGVLASVAGAAMPGIDDAAVKAATEDELTAAAVNVTPKRSPGPDSHRAPVRQRTSGTYLTPERAKEEASFWGG